MVSELRSAPCNVGPWWRLIQSWAPGAGVGWWGGHCGQSQAQSLPSSVGAGGAAAFHSPGRWTGRASARGGWHSVPRHQPPPCPSVARWLKVQVSGCSCPCALCPFGIKLGLFSRPMFKELRHHIITLVFGALRHSVCYLGVSGSSWELGGLCSWGPVQLCSWGPEAPD